MATDAEDGRPVGPRPESAPDRNGADRNGVDRNGVDRNGVDRNGTEQKGAGADDTTLPDATRRFDPVVPDASAEDATVRLGPAPAEEEEALTWQGDELTERLVPAGSSPARATGGSGAAAGSALLVVYGALAGIYLLMTIGWIATALRFQPTSDDPLGAFMERLASLLAVASPAAWFAITSWLTRGRPAWQRILWLALGILLVAPWQLVTGTLP
jgi:hypothetical protein